MSEITVELRMSDKTRAFLGRDADEAIDTIRSECTRRGIQVDTIRDGRTLETVLLLTGEAAQITPIQRRIEAPQRSSILLTS